MVILDFVVIKSVFSVWIVIKIVVFVCFVMIVIMVIGVSLSVMKIVWLDVRYLEIVINVMKDFMGKYVI